MNKDRIYLDTSVFGGVFDDEFKEISQTLFDEIREEQFSLVTSALVQEEIKYAPQKVRDFFESQLPLTEILEINMEVLTLREGYLKAGILNKKNSNDALHVALASIANCKIIVSWNFKHIVHFDKIRLFNSVNIEMGYKSIEIYSPREVTYNEETD